MEHETLPVTFGTLDAVFDTHVERVYQFLYRRVGNREDAEDLTSEVFLKASRELDLQRSDPSIARWLFTVARTVLMDHWRRYYRHGPLLPIDDDRYAITVPEESHPTTAADETEGYVREILAALPPRYRRVLELRFLSGLTIRETAEEMAVSVENAKVLQHRALARAGTLSNVTPDPKASRTSARDRANEPLVMQS